jgi:hypothetical protein
VAAPARRPSTTALIAAEPPIDKQAQLIESGRVQPAIGGVRKVATGGHRRVVRIDRLDG